MKLVEGVLYYRFKVSYVRKHDDGTWRRRFFYTHSPGFPWVRQEAARYLDARFGVGAIQERSATITLADD